MFKFSLFCFLFRRCGKGQQTTVFLPLENQQKKIRILLENIRIKKQGGKYISALSSYNQVLNFLIIQFFATYKIRNVLF